MSKQNNQAPKAEIKSDEIDFEALNNPTSAKTEEIPVIETDPKVALETPKAATQEEIEKGVIKDTPKEEESISEESSGVVNTIFENIQNKLGIEFSPEDLEGIEITEDLDTVNKIAELGGKKYGEKVFYDLVNSHPDIQKAINYIQANGSLQGIEEQTLYPDYSQADLSREEVREGVYRDYLSIKGIEGEEAEDMITLAKDKGQLDSKAKSAQIALDNYFKSLEAETNSKNAKIIEDRQKEVQQTISEFSGAIKKGKILGVNLDTKEQKAFTDYLFKPVDKSGKTARELFDDAEMSLEQELYLEYLKFKRFESVTPKVDKKVKTLKDLKAQNAGRKTEIGNSEMTTGNFNTGNEIDWEALEKLPMKRR